MRSKEADARGIFALVLVSLVLAGVLSGGIGCTFVSAQTAVAPTLAWQQILPDESGVSANQIIQTSDGGYAVVGEGNYKNSSPGAFVKLDSSGEVQWSRNYGLVKLVTLVQTPDDGYTLIGYDFRGTSRSVLLKTDSGGNELWNQSYTELTVNSMLPAPDGGYIFAGSASATHGTELSDSDFALAKVDLAGLLEWNKTYGGAGDDNAVSVVQTSDDGYALAGTTKSFGPEGGSNMWLVKTNSEGNMQWDKAFGGLGDSAAYSVTQTCDDGYVLAGDTTAFGLGGYDAWLIKTDSAGNLLWTRTYGGTGELPDLYGDLPTNFVAGSNGNGEDHAYCVIQTSDGGLAFVGASSYTPPPNSATTLVWLAKTDSAGNPQWNQTFGTPFKTWAGNALIETSDGAFAIAGYTQEPGFPWIGNYYVVKTEPASPLPSLNSTPSASPSSPPALAFPSTTILADGNIDPSTAPIQRSGNFYTLTDDLNGQLVIKKDNIIFDGGGYTLQGNGTAGGLIIRKSQTGVDLTDQTNVTVANLQIYSYNYGTYLQNSTNITLSGNIITQNDKGIFEKNSSFVTIFKNNITANDYGVFITDQSFNNNLSNNHIESSMSFGVTLNQSVGNIIFGNNLTTSSVDFESGSNNLVAGNLFYSGYFGIYMNGETNSTVAANNFTACSFAIDSPGGAFGNLFYMNSFNNTHTNEFSGKEHSAWDNGTLGNYWSDYFTRYPNATEIGNSGIGDTPYAMVYGLTEEHPYDSNVPNPSDVDRYPLLAPVSIASATALAQDLVSAHSWSPAPTPTSPPSPTPSPSTSSSPDSSTSENLALLVALGIAVVIVVAAVAFKLKNKQS
jgi:parallel beta-helix repeat protein